MCKQHFDLPVFQRILPALSRLCLRCWSLRKCLRRTPALHSLLVLPVPALCQPMAPKFPSLGQVSIRIWFPNLLLPQLRYLTLNITEYLWRCSKDNTLSAHKVKEALVSQGDFGTAVTALLGDKV